MCLHLCVVLLYLNYQELFTRLVVLLHDPLAREHRATHILSVRIPCTCLLSITIIIIALKKATIILKTGNHSGSRFHFLVVYIPRGFINKFVHFSFFS